MTITIHELIAAICPDAHAEDSFRREMRQLMEAGKADIEDPVPEQILGLQDFVLACQVCTEAVSEHTPRPDIPIRQPASPGDHGRAALARCGRAFQ